MNDLVFDILVAVLVGLVGVLAIAVVFGLWLALVVVVDRVVGAVDDL